MLKCDHWRKWTIPKSLNSHIKIQELSSLNQIPIEKHSCDAESETNFMTGAKRMEWYMDLVRSDLVKMIKMIFLQSFR